MNKVIDKLKDAIEAQIKKDIADKITEGVVKEKDKMLKETKIASNSEKITLEGMREKATAVLKEKIALKKEIEPLRNKGILLDKLMESDLSENQKGIIYDKMKKRLADKTFTEQLETEVLKLGNIENQTPVKRVKNKEVGLNIMSEDMDMNAIMQGVSEIMKAGR